MEFLNDRAIAGRKAAGGFVIEVSTGKNSRPETYLPQASKMKCPLSRVLPKAGASACCIALYCHGYEVAATANRDPANGEPAVELATLISNWTSNLTVYTNGTSTISREQAARFVKHGIAINESVIEKSNWENGYTYKIWFRNGKNAAESPLCTPAFVQHSGIPAALGEITPEGYIKTDPAQRTTVPWRICLWR